MRSRPCCIKGIHCRHKKDTRSLTDGKTTEGTIKEESVWVGKIHVGQRKECTHSVAHRAFQRSILFGLAADVVEGEKQMVVVCKIGGNLHLHLLIELRRPFEQELNTSCKEETKSKKLDSLQWEVNSEG